MKTILAWGAAALAYLPLLSGVAPPASAQSTAPGLRHESVFDGYRGFDEVAPGSWRALNDTVGAAALAPPGSPAAATAAPAAKAEGHDAHGTTPPGQPSMRGHGMHGQGRHGQHHPPPPDRPPAPQGARP